MRCDELFKMELYRAIEAVTWPFGKVLALRLTVSNGRISIEASKGHFEGT